MKRLVIIAKRVEDKPSKKYNVEAIAKKSFKETEKIVSEAMWDTKRLKKYIKASKGFHKALVETLKTIETTEGILKKQLSKKYGTLVANMVMKEAQTHTLFLGQGSRLESDDELQTSFPRISFSDIVAEGSYAKKFKDVVDDNGNV